MGCERGNPVVPSIPSVAPAIPTLPSVPGVPAIPPPLGLPTGSVRAVLAFIMCASIWYLALHQLTIPAILLDSVLLVIGFYFGVRAGTGTVGAATTPAAPGTKVKQPLHLPRGSVRTLLLVGFFGTIGYLLYQGKGFPDSFTLILQVMSSYVIGYVSAVIVHRRRMAGKPVIRAIVWFHNLNAVAVIGLVAYSCAVFIFQWPAIFGSYTENLLAWAVAYYFGSRLPS